ncbi:hypothetical protein BVRB_6g130020 [Beta vulgaris subsp. vulgaris]|nr:hypothetical protein BVRB_6g130020 [Beta vulgaris subsp. vulgaris]
MLVWDLLHEILAFGSVTRNIPNFSPICIRCSDSHENYLYLFRDSPNSVVLWSIIFQRSNLLPPDSLSCFLNSDWRDRAVFYLKLSASWASTFAVAMWHMWRTH